MSELSGGQVRAKRLFDLSIVFVKSIYRYRGIFLTFSCLASSIFVQLLSSCTFQPTSVTLSSGPAGGYYNRMAEQISNSTETTVGIKIRNLDSQGSQENLQRLFEHQADFALVQLDIANRAMQQGKVRAVAVVANEYVQIITVKNSGLQTFADIQGKRVAVGTPGSGIRFTTNQLINADKLTIQQDDSDLNTAFRKLNSGQVDALAYVGSPIASKNIRQHFVNNPNLKILPLEQELINHLTILNPDSYQRAILPIGTYTARPPIPDKQIPTLSTATVLVTRPDIDQEKVKQVTWSILSTARTYSQFYPELQNGKANELLRKGLFYIHPAAEEVFEEGDPSGVIIRYWKNNPDLQSGVFILVTTSLLGLMIQQWRRRSSQKMLNITNSRINQLKNLLVENPQQALKAIEDLSQEHRLIFLDGVVTTEVYEQLQQKTQTFANECRLQLEQQRRKFVTDTLLLLDEWQATLQSNPDVALLNLSQLKQHYRDMLLADQIDIEAYIELMELTLISIMTLVPRKHDFPQIF
ncbi:MAG: TAXI family TRAP transporter solute-binding subunit [Fischerella sp.]|nr:TAXI family TRAP transporter solute-binding subunit [Fischerella sp.]